MTRKHFLKLSITVVAVPTSLAKLGCGDDGEDGGATTGTDGTGPATDTETTGPMTTGTTQTTTAGATDTATTTTTTATDTGTTVATDTATTGTGTTGAMGMCDMDLVLDDDDMTNPHNHMVTIPLADIEAGTAETYMLSLALDHTHDLELTPADFEMLQAGETIMVESTAGAGDVPSHTHVVTITCV